jgi:hypothetical protein
MIIKYAILLAILLIIVAFAVWAFLPARRLPGNRARHLRILSRSKTGFSW